MNIAQKISKTIIFSNLLGLVGNIYGKVVFCCQILLKFTQSESEMNDI